MHWWRRGSVSLSEREGRQVRRMAAEIASLPTLLSEGRLWYALPIRLTVPHGCGTMSVRQQRIQPLFTRALRRPA
jgi:hypothetical protein